MGKQRKNWPTDTKEQSVLAVLGGQLNVAEVARQHGVNEGTSEIKPPISATELGLVMSVAIH
ncbi:hypothetical protein DAETH_36710 (plasmid) [Deinococcus aetherius]|uniref:Transposase n=1 Tax=Deinococcus aetherius TaxID=200252 RepID=A0ABM8AIQ0_9DEIO|nr:hypothetical protein DAETH_36710 [Deinococcus aetherius]